MPSVGVESEWKMIATLIVTSGKIALVDPLSFDSFDFQLPAGKYSVQIKTMTFDEEDGHRVSRLRALHADTAQIGEFLDEISTDAATVAIVDANALQPDFTEEWERHEAEIQNAWQSGDLHGTVQWGDADDATMIFVSTGFGDGEFEVNELVNDGKRVGFEIAFIEPGTRYPFQAK